jgi:hypothetical protein
LYGQRLLRGLPLFNRYVGVHGNFECDSAFLDDEADEIRSAKVIGLISDTADGGKRLPVGRRLFLTLELVKALEIDRDYSPAACGRISSARLPEGGHDVRPRTDREAHRGTYLGWREQ